MNNIISSRWLNAFGAALMLLCFDIQPARAVAITLGSRIDITASTFALPIQIVDAVGVSEWFLDLTYDPTDVQVNLGCDPFGGDSYCSLLTGPVTEGEFFAAGVPFNLLVPGFVELDPITFTQAGRLFGMHGAFGGSPPAPSGNGILAYIEFTLLGAGDSPIQPGGSVVSEPDPVSVPEPGTLALLAGGLALLGGRRLSARGGRHRTTTRRGGSMNAFSRVHSRMFAVSRSRAAIVTCVALASLSMGASAIAQALPPAIELPPDLPVLMPAPPSYPPTVAPTAAMPYFAPPAWAQTLTPNVRFVILSNFNSDAVLDRETGLVWARSTVTEAEPPSRAASVCRGLIVANRMGWRLPGVAELQSLLDISLPESNVPRLPVGHPFRLSSSNLTHDYWANETYSFGLDASPSRRFVRLTSGGAGSQLFNNDLQRGVMCVRGPGVSNHAERP